MTRADRPAFLRLVHSVEDVARPEGTVSVAKTAQGLFFPSTSPNTLIFADWAHTSLADLMDILELSKPKIVFDFRVTPQFDLETLSRRRFFELLGEHGCQYIDLFGRVGISNAKDASANPVLIAGRVSAFLSSLTSKNQGPFVFLYDDPVFDDDYIHLFATTLPPLAAPWQVFSPSVKNGAPSQENDSSLPTSEVSPLVRRTVFISHATPEDNDFVKWLASKLTIAGYEVWSDITHLQGGDAFWSDIEVAIRQRAAKVLFVHSRNAKNKIGTRKEIYLALKTAERLGLNRFVIPIRIDDTAFDETFIELINIQAIDCRSDWLLGLKSVLSVLHRDNVPREQNLGSERFGDLVSSVRSPLFSNVSVEEELISSWLRVEQLPAAVNFFACNGLMPNEVAEAAGELSIPAFGYFTLLATTGDIDGARVALARRDLAHVHLTLRLSVTWNDFIAGIWGDLPKPTLSEARRLSSLLLNRAFTEFLNSQDAAIGLLANNRPFWFFRNNRLPKNEIRFSDHRGTQIRRQLVGYSNKRRVYWHFGIQSRFSFMGDMPYFLITPHVTFSSDGKQPLISKAQLHTLRRSFCRSWWNKRWRDLLQGFISVMPSQNGVISIPSGDVLPILVSDRFQKFTSPIAPVAPTHTEAEASTDDEVEDDWDELDLPEFESEADLETDSPEAPV